MKFGFDLDLEEVRKLEPEAFKDLVRERAETTYNEREIEYPVMAGLYHFTTRDPGGHKRYDREKLAEWARDRFEVELDLEDLKNKQRDEIRATLDRTQPAVHGPAGSGDGRGVAMGRADFHARRAGRSSAAVGRRDRAN